MMENIKEIPYGIAEAFLELFFLCYVIIRTQHTQKDTLAEAAGTDKEQVPGLFFQQRQIHGFIYIVHVLLCPFFRPSRNLAGSNKEFSFKRITYLEHLLSIKNFISFVPSGRIDYLCCL